MSTSSDVIGNLVKTVAKYSPEILTAIGASGVVSTSYLTGRASFKAAALLEAEPPDLSLKEKFKKTWKLYIPAAISGVVSIGCIVASNHESNKRETAMVTALALSAREFAEYREKSVEMIGASKEQKIRDEIAQDFVNNNPPSREIVMLGSGKFMCCDMRSRRYFPSTMEDLKRYQNRINELLNNGDFATLDDWYDLVGLDSTDHSAIMGWKIEHGLMELQFSHVAVYGPNGEPCIAYSFNYLEPI